MTGLIRIALAVGAVATLAVPLAASASGGKRLTDDDRHRPMFATDTRGNLLAFKANSPRHVHSTAITGLPAGVTLRGIDFRPATGDLYGLGSDKVVYRVNVQTALAIAEGAAFESANAALNSQNVGFVFNPTVERSASRATRTTTSGSTRTRATCSRRTPV